MSFKELLSWTNKALNHRLVKIIIGLFLLIVIYYELDSKGTFSQLGYNILYKLKQLSFRNILTIIFLVLANLFLEAYKWQFSLREVYNLSFYKAFKSIVTGTSLAIITPHGVGDYGGRLMYLSPNKRIEAGIINFINSLSQNIVHVLFGTIGIFFVLGFNSWIINVLYLILCLGLILLLLWLYFDLVRFEKWIIKWVWSEHWKKRLSTVTEMKFSANKKLSLLLLAFLRYCCYISLYVVLLVVFGATQELYMLYLYVAVIFLVQSGIPLPASIGALARVEIAILLLSRIQVEVSVIVLSSLSIWILNLVLPSLLGILMMSFSDGTKIQSRQLLK